MINYFGIHCYCYKENKDIVNFTIRRLVCIEDNIFISILQRRNCCCSSLCPRCFMLLAMLLNAQDFNLHTYYDNVQTSHTFRSSTKHIK